MTTYQDVLTAIRNDADAADVEAMISAETSQLTEAQMVDLRTELARTVIEAAGQGGGIDEVERIAAKGWPGLTGAANEAIKAEAARIMAQA